MIFVAPDEQTAREFAESRRHIARESSSSTYQVGLSSSVGKTFGPTKISREMCVVVKANVQRSAEAMPRVFRELMRENDGDVITVKVRVNCRHLYHLSR